MIGFKVRFLKAFWLEYDKYDIGQWNTDYGL